MAKQTRKIVSRKRRATRKGARKQRGGDPLPLNIKRTLDFQSEKQANGTFAYKLGDVPFSQTQYLKLKKTYTTANTKPVKPSGMIVRIPENRLNQM